MNSVKVTCAAFAAPVRLVCFVVGAVLAGAGVHAAVPVEESLGYASTSARVAGAAATDNPAEARRFADLFHQLQLLQQEVGELRGIVEQQAHQIKRMARDQQEQYIDLDRRLSGMRSGAAAAGATAASGAARATPSAGASSGSGSGSGSASERDAYTRAFNLMKEQQFDASASAFNRLIVDHPNGEYTPNAFYWLGELHLTKAEYEKARQSFTQVTNLYPGHQKVPDALYKLGVVYHRLGDTQRSLEFFNRVRNEHPQSSAAGLAQTYAAELR